MTEAYQLETRTEHGWQFATIVSNGSGVRFELSYKFSETPDWGLDISPVCYTISNSKGHGIQYKDAEALVDWQKLRELGEFQDGLTQFVNIWHQHALEVLNGEKT